MHSAVDKTVSLARWLETPVAIVNNNWAPTLAFAVSLGRRNVPLHLYGSGAGRWSRYCKRHATCPPVENADLFLRWLEARVRSGEIGRLAPTTDLLAYYMAKLRDEFPASVQRSITPLEDIERCLIKTRFSASCHAAGQDVPMQASPDDPDGAVIAGRAIGYPLILKPKSYLVVGMKQRGLLVHGESELRRAYTRYTVADGQTQIAQDYPELCWPMMQRYIASARHAVFSISGIKDPDRGIIAATLTMKREQWPPDIGISTVQSICNDQKILSAGLRTVDKLVSRGIFELELLADGERLLAIDLNPRAFGFIMLDIAVGNDLPWLWFQTTLGAVDSGAPAKDHPTLDCRFVVPYYFARAIRCLLGPHTGAEPGDRTAGRAWIPMLGHPSDPLPMVMANLALLRLLPHRGGLVRPYVAAAWRHWHTSRNTTS
jgi:predicted ATP-grasp superfamily ATP-dependent carboligase